MKSKEELNALKQEVDILNQRLAELDEDELEQVVGGGPKIISPLFRVIPDYLKATADVCKAQSVLGIPLDSDEKLK